MTKHDSRADAADHDDGAKGEVVSARLLREAGNHERHQDADDDGGQTAERLHGDEEPGTEVDREQQPADKFRNERGHEQIELQSLCGTSVGSRFFSCRNIPRLSPAFARYSFRQHP